MARGACLVPLSALIWVDSGHADQVERFPRRVTQLTKELADVECELILAKLQAFRLLLLLEGLWGRHRVLWLHVRILCLEGPGDDCFGD